MHTFFVIILSEFLRIFSNQGVKLLTLSVWLWLLVELVVPMVVVGVMDNVVGIISVAMYTVTIVMLPGLCPVLFLERSY